jgi:hypothetical protein
MDHATPSSGFVRFQSRVLRAAEIVAEDDGPADPVLALDLGENQRIVFLTNASDESLADEIRAHINRHCACRAALIASTVTAPLPGDILPEAVRGHVAALPDSFRSISVSVVGLHDSAHFTARREIESLGEWERIIETEHDEWAQHMRRALAPQG